LLGLVAVTALALGGAPPQEQHIAITSFKGEVHFRSNVDWFSLTVELDAVGGGGLPERADVRPDGSFEFHGIPAGFYHASIVDDRGQVIHRQQLAVTNGQSPARIEIEDAPRQNFGVGIVSVTGLRQKPPAAAIRSWRLARKASEKGDFQEAVSHLQTVVALAPDLPAAHNDLGAAYLRSEKLGPARRELETAIALDTNVAIPHVNMALALLALGSPREAEVEARKALRLDPLSPEANYAAGVALERADKSTSEALRFLDQASERIPQALLIEARILQAKSRSAEAVDKLRSYLLRCDAAQKPRVAKWLEALSVESMPN